MTDLAPISIEGFDPMPPPDLARPELMWAPIERMVIDRGYQRPITGAGKALIHRIAAEFDWAKFQPVLVARRTGGVLAIVDGQHRVHAAKLAGLAEVPAMVVQMDLQRQALAFAAVNRDRIGLKSHAIYRAELAGGAAWAIACRDVVEAAGCKMATSNPTASSKRPGMIYALRLIRRMVEQGEGEAVTAGLAAIRQSEAGAEVESYSGPVIAIWLPALARNQRFLRLDLPDIFDGLYIPELTEVYRRKARLEGGSARAMAIDHVVHVLRDAGAAE